MKMHVIADFHVDHKAEADEKLNAAVAAALGQVFAERDPRGSRDAS